MSDHSGDMSENEDISMLRDSAAALAKAEAGSGRPRVGDPDVASHIWHKLAEAGFLGMAIAEDHGGLGMGLGEVCAVAGEFGKALLPAPFLPGAFLPARLIGRSENEDLQRELLPALATGQLIVGLAFEETPEGVFSACMKTRALPQASGVRLGGDKRFVRPGAGCHGFIVAAAAPEGTGLYWVVAGSPGLEIIPGSLADGCPVARLRLDDVRVEENHILSPAPMGTGLLTAAINETLIAAGAELNGVMSAALTLTLDYLRTRVQFGRPVGSFQAIQHRAVNMYLEQQLSVATLGASIAEFARSSDAGQQIRLASRVKARASDAALLITREALQMHGAIGFTDECDIGRYLKRALSLSGWLGNAAEHRRRYSTSLQISDEARNG